MADGRHLARPWHLSMLSRLAWPRPLAWLRHLARRPRLPLRWWLSILNAVVAGGTLLLLGGALLSMLDGQLQDQLADDLRAQTVPIVQRELGIPPPAPPKPFGKPAIKLVPPDRPSLPDPPSPLDPMTTDRLRNLAARLIRDVADRDTGVVVYDLRRRVVAASTPGQRREGWPPAPRESFERAVTGSVNQRVVSDERRRALAVLLPLQLHSGEIVGVLEVTTSLDLADVLRTRITLALGIGTVLVVLVAGGLAVLVTRSALGPLDRMIRVTRRVAAGDLSARVDLDRRDEVGELATSFDQMVGRLETAFANQRRLVSDAAHELRTPLNGLAGTLEIVQVALERQDAEAARRLLSTVERELDRAGRLVNDLLTLSSLDERSATQVGPVALVPMLRDVMRRARILAPDHEIVARLDTPATVTGDRDQLERVFANLLDNAVKYTPVGGRVEVALQRAGAEVRVSVRDTGRGIPPDDLPRIFDRFYRADRARSRQEGGTGLGLAIVQAIVQAHGGRVEAESALGVGTTIRVHLPATPDAPIPPTTP